MNINICIIMLITFKCFNFLKTMKKTVKISQIFLKSFDNLEGQYQRSDYLK